MNESELLFTEILNCNRVSLYLNKDSRLTLDKASLVSSVLKKRVTGEPIQYILGKTEFMGLEFKVRPPVFIPRPETEILVETVLKLAGSLTRLSVDSLRILDLGTGSGCIAVSLAKFLPNAKIDAIDISGKALEIARKNARLNNVEINFIHADLLTSYELGVRSYDIIVCNPPYIPTAEIDRLQPEIRYEPRIALDGGSDGLDFYRKIIRDAPYYLEERGFLVMEMGFDQKNDIENIFQDSGKFDIVKILKDYNAFDRVIVARKS